MKLSLNTDFTKLPRAGAVLRSADKGGAEPFDVVVLDHGERHLRRRVLALKTGGQVLVDLLEPATLHDGDLLVLDDGRHVAVAASLEEVYIVRARTALHQAELAWHIGGRHQPIAIEADRIVILRDHVTRDVLEALGATVTEAVESFTPLRGAGSGHVNHDGHDHHGHAGGPDAFGRRSGDPHYGHNHP